MSVAAETLSSGGRAYRVVVKLRESGGAAATISSIDLTFMNGSSTIASSHADRPISDAANVCPANATVDSRELMTTDDNPSNPLATSVVAKVTFTDGASTTSSTTGSADVPAPPAPEVFTLAGVVSDESTGRSIADGAVRVVDGPNAGKSASTDGNGYYSMPGVTSGSFTVRATANGYDQRDQGVTVSRDTRLDLKLRRISGAPTPTPPPSSGACGYTISPSTKSVDWKGGAFTATITNTSGNCSWQATSNVSWITIVGSASGNGSATLSYSVITNGSVVSIPTRVGSITISWPGGSTQHTVGQAGPSLLCEFTVSTGQQDLGNIPSAGGQYAATITSIDTGLPPGVCSITASSDPWITLPITFFPQGVSSLTFTVSPNPSPGSSRTGTVSLRGRDRNATIIVTQR